MSSRFDANQNLVRRFTGLVACICLAVCTSSASAQFFNGQQIQQIGGVLINSKGVVQNSSADLDKEARDAILKQLGKVDGQLADKVQLRMVSLRGLHAEMAKAVEKKTKISEEAQYLAGLLRVEYVLLVPEKNDILIGGPAEGWKVDEQGNVVGKTTGLPVLRLEDLMVALRSSSNARQGYGISVSINPTEEGNKKLSKFLTQFQRSGSRFNERAATAVEEVMGPQDVSLTGIDKDSRFAQVLVAADYQMKRLSMGFEEAPIKGMPSFLELCQKKNSRFGTLTPRFWMECNYEPVKHTEDKLAWKIEGSVKALTENEVVEKSGKRTGTGRSNKLAKTWADNMTKNYDKLAEKQPIFAELQNIMDLSVVAALIEKEGMLKKVGLELPYMTDNGKLATPSLNVPKTVPTQCSFCALSNSTLVTASGGVQVDSWGVLDNAKQDVKVAAVRSAALDAAGENWWWNAK